MRSFQLSFMVSGIYSARRMLWFRSFGFKGKEAALVVMGLLTRWTCLSQIGLEILKLCSNFSFLLFLLIGEWFLLLNTNLMSFNYIFEIPFWWLSVTLTLNPTDCKEDILYLNIKRERQRKLEDHTQLWERGKSVLTEDEWRGFHTLSDQLFHPGQVIKTGLYSKSILWLQNHTHRHTKNQLKNKI